MIDELLPLTKNKLKILSFIYLEGETHLLNISTRLSIHPYSVQKTLKSLKMLTSSKKRGKTIVTELNKTIIDYLELLYILEDYIVSEKPKEILRIKRAVKEFFSKESSILCCCLFGSHARGGYTKESDIDLLFVVDSKSKDAEIIKSCSDISSVLGKEIMPLIMDEKEFLTAIKTKEPTITTLLNPSQRLILFGKEYFLRKTVFI